MISTAGLKVKRKTSPVYRLTSIFFFSFAYILVYFTSIYFFYEPAYKHIYFFLKSLLGNVQIIRIESDLVMFYSYSIFILFILTIIFVPINLIYSYKRKEIFIFNTRLNIKIISYFIIVGIIMIFYLFLLNNLRYVNIIHLIDTYLITLYIIIFFLVVAIAYDIDPYLDYPKKYELQRILKERDPKIRLEMMKILSIGIFMTPLFILLPILLGIIPWFSGILLGFNLFVIIEIFRKKYFLDRETFYQDLYKLSKFFNKRLIIIFGTLAFIAIFDILNKVLLDNYTLQPTLEPIIMAEEEEDYFMYTVLSPLITFLYFIFYIMYCSSYRHLNYYLNYYVIAENIDYKIKEGYHIKNVKVDPMITFLSYLGLFIVFLINLIL
jgi:hypothetical protein